MPLQQHWCIPPQPQPSSKTFDVIDFVLSSCSPFHRSRIIDQIKLNHIGIRFTQHTASNVQHSASFSSDPHARKVQLSNSSIRCLGRPTPTNKGVIGGVIIFPKIGSFPDMERRRYGDIYTQRIPQSVACSSLRDAKGVYPRFRGKPSSYFGETGPPTCYARGAVLTYSWSYSLTHCRSQNPSCGIECMIFTFDPALLIKASPSEGFFFLMAPIISAPSIPSPK